MDIFSILGLLLGVGAVLGAMIFKHVPFSSLLNPAALLIILAGTVATVMIATPPSDLKNVGKLFLVVFGKQRSVKRADAIERIDVYAKTARTEGILALESKVSEEPDPFLARCLQLVVDGTESEQIEEFLGEDVAAMEQRHAGNAQIFSQAGSYAPTLGVLGAVLGLIAALGDLSDMDRLSAAISAAFIATVLGIFTGYVLWHPMANKLKRKSRLEAQTKTMMIIGICNIANGKNPRTVRDSMLVFLTEKERKAIEKG